MMERLPSVLEREVFTVPVIGERPELDLNAVVYGTDFSVCSQNAGLYAAFLARHFSTALMVAHAFTLSQAAMEVEIDPSLVSQQRKDLEFLLSREGLRAVSWFRQGHARPVRR